MSDELQFVDISENNTLEIKASIRVIDVVLWLVCLTHDKLKFVGHKRGLKF